MKLVRPEGYMNWVLPLMLAFAATDVLVSGRDLSLIYAELAGTVEGARHPAMAWLQRGTSLVLLFVSLERIAHHLAQGRPVPSAPLLWAYVAFWIGTVAFPSLLGAHPVVSHEYGYALVIGIAALLVTTQEIGRIADSARNALFLLMLVSVLLVPVWPTLVLDASYRQGLMPGVPRLGGLAPHPVAMGMFAQIGLLLLWVRPFQRRWLTVLAWVLGLGVLFFAQSKNAWIAFILCSMAMVAVRNGPSMWRRLGDPQEGTFGIMLCLGVIALALALLGVFLFTDIASDVSGFLDSEQGAQLTSLTGRDQIWAIALEEWQAHKVFGYGPGLFDDDFRMSVGMPQATNAHNQFMDTLARSGTVGTLALVAYAIVLLVLSLRYAKRTGGLSLALFITLALRSVSEVPLLLFGYGTEFFAHLLLIVTLAAGASMRVPLAATRRRPAYGVPA